MRKLAVQNKPRTTGWDSIDKLLSETEEALEEYNVVDQKVNKALSSFKPKRPSLTKIRPKHFKLRRQI